MLLENDTIDSEWSITPNISKPAFDEKSPGNSFCYNNERLNEDRKSLKESRMYIKCPHCRKIFNQFNLKQHLLTCKHVTHHEIFHSQERSAKVSKALKCNNCEYTLAPKAKFCMMCGLKVFDNMV